MAKLAVLGAILVGGSRPGGGRGFRIKGGINAGVGDRRRSPLHLHLRPLPNQWVHRAGSGESTDRLFHGGWPGGDQRARASTPPDPESLLDFRATGLPRRRDRPRRPSSGSSPIGGIVTSPLPLPPGFVANGYNYQSNVTWEYLLGPTIDYTNPGPNGVFLGEFTVNTSWSYAAGQPPPWPPAPLSTIATWSAERSGRARSSSRAYPSLPHWS